MYNFRIEDEPYARGFINESSSCITKKVAAGLLLAAKEMPITIYDEIGLPNAAFNIEPVGVYYAPWGSTFMNNPVLDKKIETAGDLAGDYQFIKDEIMAHDFNTNFYPMLTHDEICSMFLNGDRTYCITGTLGGLWGGHAVPNLIDIAKYGTVALRQKVNDNRKNNPDAQDFYDALIMVLDAIDILGDRFAALAAQKAEEASGSIKTKYARLANTFNHCPRKPAVTFADACNVFVLLFTWDGVDSPGHFDQYMIDFWRNSDIEEAREMLDDIWEFFHITRSWNLCISGSDENWNDLTNELSYEILDITARKRYHTPNLTLRWHRNTPEKLMRAAYRSIATGCGLPALYNDEAVCPALERMGIPPQDSHLYVMNGCNQIDIQGKSHIGLEDGHVNLAKAVELTFSNGVCTLSGEKIGPDTGDAANFKTYQEFYWAFIQQLHYHTDLAISMANKGQIYHRDHTGHPLRSLTIEGCLEKGLDYKNSGPLYGDGQMLADGIANTADSLAAVKYYVFDTKRFTMKEMRDALAADFEGYEEMYHVLRNSPLRFGNDNDYVDSIAKDVIDNYNHYLLTKPTIRGGYYGGGCSPFVGAPQAGKTTGALPSGKRKGEAMFADSIGANPGEDVNGPTALLNSCMKFDHTLPTSGFILNVKFDKKLFNSPRGEEGFLALCRTYFEGKAQQLSFTVVSAEELLDAVEHPENHKNLLVRVGGYTGEFVTLNKQLQENIIARTIHSL